MSTNQSFLQAMKSLHVGKRVLTSYSLDVGHYHLLKLYYYFYISKAGWA